jgi:hypothetical protein
MKILCDSQDLVLIYTFFKGYARPLKKVIKQCWLKMSSIAKFARSSPHFDSLFFSDFSDLMCASRQSFAFIPMVYFCSLAITNQNFIS